MMPTNEKPPPGKRVSVAALALDFLRNRERAMGACRQPKLAGNDHRKARRFDHCNRGTWRALNIEGHFEFFPLG